MNLFHTFGKTHASIVPSVSGSSNYKHTLEGALKSNHPLFLIERTWPYYAVRPCLYKHTILVLLKMLRPKIWPSQDAPPFVTCSPGGVKDFSIDIKGWNIPHQNITISEDSLLFLLASEASQKQYIIMYKLVSQSVFLSIDNNLIFLLPDNSKNVTPVGIMERFPIRYIILLVLTRTIFPKD